ncbi:MAG: acyltransferase family protein [Lautropia sp.]
MLSSLSGAPAEPVSASPAAADRASFTTNNFVLVRLVAALLVAVAHVAERFPLSLGAFEAVLDELPGVAIFFVISGFLVSAAWERSPTTIDFFRNRLLRILPGLWVCLGATTIVAGAFGVQMATPRAALWLLTQGVGLIHTPSWLAGFGYGSYNGSLWTLPIELQFYVALPLLYRALSKASAPTSRLLVIWVLFTAFTLAWPIDSALFGGPHETLAQKLMRYALPLHDYLFLAGVCLQRLRVDRSRWIRGKGLAWLALYSVCAISFPPGKLESMVKLLLLGLTFISLAYTTPTLSNRLLRNHDVSYGIFLYHGLLINVFIELGRNRDWSYGLLCLGLSMLLGHLSLVLVEQPAVRLWRRRANARRQASASIAAGNAA